MKKITSMLLAILVVMTALVPAFTGIQATTERAPDAYATVFTASDFQYNSSDTSPNIAHFVSMVGQLKADGVTETPNGIIFGGDYTSSSESPTTTIPVVKQTVDSLYPGYDTENDIIYVQGNHDSANSLLSTTGLHEFEHYWVYVINEDDYSANQSSSSASKYQTLAANLRTALESINDNRPVFIATHVPLHHSSRSSYGDTYYAKYIFDVVNEFATQLDIVFLFGHNHSSTYDDYIGGAVNYIAKGETIRIAYYNQSAGASAYTEETLNFTYMNYGYVGHSSNSNTSTSTSTLTMCVFEFCSDRLEVSRYSETGLYSTETIERINPHSTDPYATLPHEGTVEVAVGSGEQIAARSGYITNPVYTWTSSDSSIVEVSGTGKNASLIYKSIGEATITVTVTGTDADGQAVSISDSYIVKPIVASATLRFEPTTSITVGKRYIFVKDNAAGSTYLMTNEASNAGDGGSAVRLAQTAATIQSGEDSIYIEISSDDLSAVWVAENYSGNSTHEYIKSAETGKYLYSTSSDLGTNDSIGTTNSYIWTVDSSGIVHTNLSSSSQKVGIRYSGTDGNFRSSKTGASNVYLYEEVSSATYSPSSTLTLNSSDVNGTTQTLYNISAGDQIMLNGEFSGFGTNGADLTVTWSSSEPSVATVENGIVSVAGEGTTDITYTVSDGTTTLTKTVTLVLNEGERPVTRYVPTNLIIPGRRYIAVTTTMVGSAYVMGNVHIASDGARLNQISAIVLSDDEDGVYVELPTEDLSPVWVAESSSNSGYSYLKNAESGEYLYSTETELMTGASVDTSNEDYYLWTSTEDGIYETNYVNGSVTVGIKHSSDGNFRSSKTDASDIYIYEELTDNARVNIRLRYQNVDAKAINLKDVLPYQAETLVPVGSNFPDNEMVTYSWASDNSDVATVKDGVVTFTGNTGTARITVTATSTVPDENGNYPTATSYVTYNITETSAESEATKYIYTDTFVDGEYYVFSNANSSGSASALSNTTVQYSSSEYRLSSESATVSTNESGETVISNNSDATLWQAVAYSGSNSAYDGYFYFINAETGEYLMLFAEYPEGSTSATLRRVTTIPADEVEANIEACLIKLCTLTANGTTINHGVSSYLVYNDLQDGLKLENDQFRLSRALANLYFYQRVLPETVITEAAAEIRINSFSGTEDITNELQSRYEVQENDTEQLLAYTEGFDSIASITWEVDDTSIATISENGLLTFTGRNGFVNISMTVVGTDADGNTVTEKIATTYNISSEAYTPPTEDYPDYPHEGAVRVNKTASNTAGGTNFQTSGVTEVELSVTGVPLPQAVDVVIVFDHSSSMNDESRLTNAIANTRNFAMQLIAKNQKNRIAIVTFDRYRDLYESFADTTPDYSTYPSSNEDRIITGDGTAEGAFVGAEDSEILLSQIDSLANNSTSGTNYDYGLKKAYDILAAAKAQREAGDTKVNAKQFVVFMSDGEPFVHNRLLRDNVEDSLFFAWSLGEEENTALSEYLADPETYPVAQYFNPDGQNWFAQAIKAKENNTIPTMPRVDYYEGYNIGLGATIFSIGYGSDANTAEGTAILQNIASSPDRYYYAASDLQAAYDSILESIVYAANNAVVTDEIGENYDVQFAPSFTLGNNQATITLNPAPKFEVGAWTLNSDGSRNEYRILETITFVTNENGYLTAAYSSVKGANTNIYNVTSNDISGEYVSYNLSTEMFTWRIGDITRDEVTLKYYAYLTGSAEGEREAGIYNTNEYAVLHYINYLGNQCQQVFPVPSKGWKQAAINYEFYLVNGKGDPVNKQGMVVPFAERVLIGREQTKELYLNTANDYSAYTLIAADELPEGYVLFNPNTSYNVNVSSGDNPSSAYINDNVASHTTFFRDGTLTTSGHGEVEGVSDYTNTHISFAVLHSPGVVPDSVVIDYGLPVKITVLANDVSARAGAITAIGTSLKSGTELHTVAYTESRIADGVTSGLILNNGTASIDGENLVYTPNNLEMSNENVFYYEYKTNEGDYYYTTVTVIPAANIYYEESFFTFNDGNGYSWQTVGTTLEDKFQAEDRPGTFTFAAADADNVYGRDNAYNDSYTYSLGSSKFTTVDAASVGKEPTAEFTFCGTGFDLFSVTNSDTGAVLVTIYKSDGTRYKNYIVQTYYGYTYADDKYTPNPDSTDVLYQVPVISARELEYGTYTAVIKPIYSYVFDMDYDKTGETYNSYDIYVDSVRIYNPAGATPDADSVVGGAYLEDGEYKPEYLEIRRNILTAKEFYDDLLAGTEYSKGSIFIDSIGSLDSSGISDKYLESGPNNETYLAKGQAIAFHIQSDTPLTLSSIQLGMKVVKGNEADVAIMNTKELAANIINVSGSHEMYRRLNSAIVWDQDKLAEGKYYTKYPIVIANTSDSILSLTEFKWAYSDAPEAGASGLSLAVTSTTPSQALAATKNVVQGTDGDNGTVTTPFENENISINWSGTSFKTGEEAILTVITPIEVVKVTVGGTEITQCEIDENGNKKWTYSFTVTEVGENTFEVILYDSKNNSSKPIATETINVEEEPVEEKSFFEKLFDAIVNFFKKIINFVWRVFA